jgi:hypothetical protein
MELAIVVAAIIMAYICYIQYTDDTYYGKCKTGCNSSWVKCCIAAARALIDGIGSESPVASLVKAIRACNTVYRFCTNVCDVVGYLI